MKKPLRNDQNDLQMTYKWPWDQKPLHHYVFHEKKHQKLLTFLSSNSYNSRSIHEKKVKTFKNDQKWP